MHSTTLPDEVTMSLVERVLACPENEREAYLHEECRGDSELYGRAWDYIEWEKRMAGFLLDPLYPSSSSDYTFEAGQLLMNRFRIIRQIASGGMGTVWEATDEKLDRRIAIKCAKPGFARQLPPEVRNAREISHPNVCKLFEIHTAVTPRGDVDFICMEYLEGETLSQKLRRAPLSKKESLTIALQLCAGLSEAHRRGVIHGDLKSANIILSPAGHGPLRAVIMDFGLARAHGVSEGESSGFLAGTPAYMAPELWKGIKPSVASDIYALGVILWELISGLSPSDLGVTSSTLSWGERHAWKPPRGYGKWDRILGCCLQADPLKRYRSAEEVARALGPSAAFRWLPTIGIAAALAVISALMTYQDTTAPAETVRLALLPYSSDRASASVAEKLLNGTARQLTHLRSNPHTKVTFIPEDRVIRAHIDSPEKAGTQLGATHVLYASLNKTDGGFEVRAHLTNLHSGVDVKDWTGEYKPGELRYAPVALTGLVTETLHLPLATATTVNTSARKAYEAGLSALKRGDGEKAALQHFEKAVALDPESPLTYAGLAEAEWLQFILTSKRVWMDECAESARQADIRNPDLPEAHRIEGLLKAQQSGYEEAIADYSRAIELDPANSDAYRRLGRVYQDSNQLGEALVAYRKAVEVDPAQYRNYYQLGLFYRQRANLGSAVDCLRKAVKLAPQDPQPYSALGSTYLGIGQFANSEAVLRRSPRLEVDAPSMYTLGLAMIYLKRDSEAIPLINRALQLQPDHYAWWIFLGTSDKHVGNLQDARRAYQRGLDTAEAAMAENPRNGTVRAYLAYSSSQLGDRRRAEFEASQALRQSPSDADARLMTVCTYDALGMREEALAVLGASAHEVIADASRWPDLAELSKDPRFLKLLTSETEN